MQTQSELSHTIKSLHDNLRKRSKLLGVEAAWKDHCQNKVKLAKYAQAMLELATNYWDHHALSDSKVISRIQWVYNASMNYFQCIDLYRQKELKVVLSDVTSINQTLPKKFSVLDVGSCYNPFNVFKDFDVLAIDIAPGQDTVLECDFLNVELTNETVIVNNCVKQLSKESFNIVIFSLLLEYLPSPSQRLEACLKAYKLLKVEGILAIVAPDSNHIGSNAKIYKSWQFVLAKHGYVRVKYEKLPHLHCMLYRKAQWKLMSEKWAQNHQNKGYFEEIYIPQDFKSCENTEAVVKQIEWTNETFLNEIDEGID